jgi:RNA polymerase sigma factor (sigma-70 family)
MAREMQHRDRGAASNGAAAVDWTAELARHDRWLRTAVYARVGDPHAVEEVMQEVALAAVRQADRHPVLLAGPWLYRVAVRQALLYRRRCGRQRRLLDQASETLVGREGPVVADPLSWLLSQERRQMLRRGVAELAPRDAEILMLKYTENWSYHEIAAHLGISHSAVETRLHRARQRLRQRLAHYQVADVGGRNNS